ncbi:MAG: D-tyrosyl-tRNA(Tyr) deacylase [Bacteroidetes bacterium]|nr:MAG: D-tyrosyl-tRNA(Tyr) deacylase [Bacteroidota bacterium]
MRVLIQRVSEAWVRIEGAERARIGWGLLLFVGIETEDSEEDIPYLVKKVSQLRIFADEQGLMNRSIQDVEGEFLVISQFTLHASTKKGNRPSYIRAARPERAVPLYERFVEALRSASGRPVKTGEFGAHMEVGLVNDGPVTIWMDSRNRE